ncbi:MAG TPA: NAD(P)H-quinone oxidoreductase [Candidatus Angelobacter sp.]|nr:NAD(P)H-quinone oxidoreductase [Candidatus Angelobacter sp.]
MRNMRAAWISRFGGPDVLEIREVARPVPSRDQVLVKVRASGLNRADLLQREGKYPPPAGYPVEIPGIEFAGEVVGVGEAVTEWKQGQRVMGLAGGAAHAEFITTHERLLAEAPPTLSWVEAAALPEAFITAHDALWKQARLRPGEAVLINAVGSGVGLAAVQLARAIHARPYGTSRTPGKIKKAKEYGLQDGVALAGDNLDALLQSVEKWTGSKGINVFLDLVGGAYPGAAQKIMAIQGRMIFTGTVAGGKYELDSRYVMGKRLQLRGTVLRSRQLEEKIEATQAFAREVVPLLASGAMRPAIDSTFKFEEIRQAHERLTSNETVGKVVIEIE